MMFDHAHYVPVLRWKRAERAALREMDPADKDALTPLLELLPGYLGGDPASANNSAETDLAVPVKQIAKAFSAGATITSGALVRVKTCEPETRRLGCELASTIT